MVANLPVTAFSEMKYYPMPTTIFFDWLMESRWGLVDDRIGGLRASRPANTSRSASRVDLIRLELQTGQVEACPADGKKSPVELQADLPNTRIARIGDDSEITGGVDVAPRILELRVIENVEKFDAQIKGHLFSNDGSL